MLDLHNLSPGSLLNLTVREWKGVWLERRSRNRRYLLFKDSSQSCGDLSLRESVSHSRCDSTIQPEDDYLSDPLIIRGSFTAKVGQLLLYLARAFTKLPPKPPYLPSQT